MEHSGRSQQLQTAPKGEDCSSYMLLHFIKSILSNGGLFFFVALFPFFAVLQNWYPFVQYSRIPIPCPDFLESGTRQELTFCIMTYGGNPQLQFHLDFGSLEEVGPTLSHNFNRSLAAKIFPINVSPPPPEDDVIPAGDGFQFITFQ